MSLVLKLALNLEGGPIACQSIQLRGFTRKFHAQWESQYIAGKALLPGRLFGSARWAIPTALTVEWGAPAP